MIVSALVCLFACVALPALASDPKDTFDYANIPQDLQIKIISSLHATDIINMSRVSATSQRQTRAALAAMQPKDVADMMVKSIQTIGASNHGKVNAFFISLSRLIDPHHYKDVAREHAIHGWNTDQIYSARLLHFVKNKRNMRNDFMIEIVA